MERKDTIRSAYRQTGGNSFYDGMITCSTLSGKAVCRLVWGMNKAECDNYLEKALSGIPKISRVSCLRCLSERAFLPCRFIRLCLRQTLPALIIRQI